MQTPRSIYSDARRKTSPLDPPLDSATSQPGWTFRYLVFAMASIWMCGICEMSGHFQPVFPLPKQIAYTVSGVLITVLLFATQIRRRDTGCGLLFLIVGGLSLAAMWIVTTQSK